MLHVFWGLFSGVYRTRTENITFESDGEPWQTMATQSKRALVPIAQVTLHAPFSWMPPDSDLGDQVLGLVFTSAFYLNGDVKTARMVCGQETNA